ncbi:odorant-binding protein 6 isoform X1 [Bombyx mori]|uniref:odorant-binding protein 6 isoform X1 n=1 Tax=Bombyx mori TaxID=7091 RepID=UPI002ED4CB02
MSANSFVVLAFCALAVGVNALTEEQKAEITKSSLPLIAECSKEFSVNQGDIDAAKKLGDPSGLNSCFVGCFMKKAGIINASGLFDVAATIEKSKKYLTSEEDLKAFEKLTETCAPENDKPVSDSDKGCERAKLLLDCFVANKGSVSEIVFLSKKDTF